MLNGPASYGARDSIQCVPIESLIPFSLNEWRERTAFIFYVEPLAISRTQCPSQEDNKFYLRQNHEATVFNCTTSTREKKEKSEDLKGSLTFMWLSNSGYDSSLPRTEQPCVFICVCVLVGHLLHDLYPLTVPEFCRPSRCTGNQMCGHLTTVFTSTSSKGSSAVLFFLCICEYRGSAFGFNAPWRGDTQVMNSVQKDTLWEQKASIRLNPSGLHKNDHKRKLTFSWLVKPLLNSFKNRNGLWLAVLQIFQSLKHLK